MSENKKWLSRLIITTSIYFLSVFLLLVVVIAEIQAQNRGKSVDLADYAENDWFEQLLTDFI